MLGDEIGPDKLAKVIHEDIAAIRISRFAKLAVPVLPLLLRQQPPLDLREQGHRPVTGFGFELILSDQHQLFVHGGFRNLVPDGDGLVAEIDRVPCRRYNRTYNPKILITKGFRRL